MHQPSDWYFESPWSQAVRITRISALSSARPASLPKGLQFSGQPVKIMASESLFTAGRDSRRVVNWKDFG
jgi:hypothetical protein